MLARFKTLSVNRFTFITALFYVCIFNIPLFGIIKRHRKTTGCRSYFSSPLCRCFSLALSFVFSLFTVKYLVAVFIILTLLSSSVFFAAYQYNVVFDYGMIENTFQTNHAEALMYVNFASIMNMLLTGFYLRTLSIRPIFSTSLSSKSYCIKCCLCWRCWQGSALLLSFISRLRRLWP